MNEEVLEGEGSSVRATSSGSVHQRQIHVLITVSRHMHERKQHCEEVITSDEPLLKSLLTTREGDLGCDPIRAMVECFYHPRIC
jgi:hypothetical protein